MVFKYGIRVLVMGYGIRGIQVNLEYSPVIVEQH